MGGGKKAKSWISAEDEQKYGRETSLWQRVSLGEKGEEISESGYRCPDQVLESWIESEREH